MLFKKLQDHVTVIDCPVPEYHLSWSDELKLKSQWKPTASLNDIADYAGVGIAPLHRVTPRMYG
ncbi:hypothetical protein XI25_20235 [Paenibacillus sp. DMB20]|nr:hypothetical protein XI25_20235 [Paenibacillus sp. DMB20]